MGTNELHISTFNNPSEAPVFREPLFKAANLTDANVVGKGTVEGKATVDLIFIDDKGNRYMTMITGAILRGLVSVVDGVEQR